MWIQIQWFWVFVAVITAWAWWYARDARLFYAMAQIGAYTPMTVHTHRHLGTPIEVYSYYKVRESLLVPVRSQGTCASCWAFAVADMLADRVSVMTGGAFRRALSVQELVGCFKPQNFTCARGGIPEMAIYYPMMYGLVWDELYPYTQERTRLIKPCQVPHAVGLREALLNREGIEERYPMRVFAKTGTNRSLCVPPSTPEDIARNVLNMKMEIMRNGPIVGTIMVYDDLYNYDAESVYRVSPGAQFRGGHAIEIYGWSDAGQNTEEEGFQDAYWICRNSWGKRWPRHMDNKYGWFYVAMGVNEAGIESRASACLPVLTEAMREAARGVSRADVAYKSYTEYVQDPERQNFFAHLQRRREKRLAAAAASRRDG